MAVILRSGADTTEAIVDTTSKALRVTLYDPAGNELYDTPSAGFVIPITMLRQSTTSAAGSEIWTMRNGATKTIKFRRIYISVTFDGTAAATTQTYQFVRFTTATPTGGTAITVIKKDTANGTATTVADARQKADGALTVTSVVFETGGYAVCNQRQVSAGSVLDVRFDDTISAYKLAPNEGLALEILATAVVGDTVAGFVEFDEV